MKFEPLEMKHREVLAERLVQAKLPFSECSFVGLYLFRKRHRYEVALGEEEVIRGVTHEGQQHVIPLTPTSLQGELLYPVQEEWLPHLDGEKAFREADSDYLFRKEKLATYPGRALSKKRNLVKQFLTHHTHEVVPVQETEAQVILDNWRQEVDKPSDAGECQEALSLQHVLNLKGLQVNVDGHPAAFILGEERPEIATFVAHFAKATRTIKGLNQFLFQALAQSLPPHITWINLEQDLGIPAIRKNKHSYHPDAMLHKWRIQKVVQKMGARPSKSA